MKYQTGSRWELIWGNQRARGIFGNWAHYTTKKSDWERVKRVPILYGNLSTFAFQTLPVSFDILTRVILILWVVLNLCSVTSNILHEVLLSQAKRENLHLDKIIFVNILPLSHVHRHKLN